MALKGSGTSSFSDLFPALVECFAIILFGYVSGRLNLITSSQAKGIGSFVGTFALPALLFKNMVQLDLSTVSWAFMVAVLVGKTVVFVIVLVFSLVLVKPRGLGRGSLYAIFSTQSNDFALGYPLIQALYGKTFPEFLQYIYLLAPVSLLILNPIGFVLLEIDKYRNRHQQYAALDSGVISNSVDGDRPAHTGPINDASGESEDEEDGPCEEKFTIWTCLGVVKGVVLNPIVFMVFVGLIGHFVFGGTLPKLLDDTLTTLGNAFSGAALFYLGLTMVGKIGQQRGLGLILPASLIAAKIILLPILIREFVLSFSNVLPVYRPDGIARNSTNMTEYIYALADFGYLYGTFPTAPTVVIYAARYGIEMDRLASGMVFCTSLSAPIMYVSAWTLSMSRMSVDFFQREVKEVDKDISIISLFCSIWCVVIFIIGRKFLNMPHLITLCFICSLCVSSLGTILWDGIVDSKTPDSTQLFLFGMMYFGVQCARLFTATIATSLVAVLWRGQQWLWNKCVYFISIPVGLSFVSTLILMLCAKRQAPTANSIFQYGMAQNIASFAILVLSFLVTVVSLIIILKSHGYADSENDSSPLLDRRESISSNGSDNGTGKVTRTFCCMTIERRFGDIQKVRHTVLLLLLILSMFIGLSLIIWRLTDMKEVGIYFEISFLDSVFNFGQGFFVFCVFGLDSDLIIDPVVRLWRKLRYGSEDISLPALSDLDKDVLVRCMQFTRYHLDDCKVDILGEQRYGLTRYQEVFTGKDFCTWLVNRGLVYDRSEATIYGQHLMAGRVLYHHHNKHYFHDQNYLYKFEEAKSCYKPATSPIMGAGGRPKTQDHSSQPGTSSTLQPGSPVGRAIASPAKTWYHGFSFEAYLNTSDAESFTASPRRQTPRSVRESNKDDLIKVSVNNNCNVSDSSEPGGPVAQRQRKKKVARSTSSKLARRKNDLSDSSF